MDNPGTGSADERDRKTAESYFAFVADLLDQMSGPVEEMVNGLKVPPQIRGPAFGVAAMHAFIVAGVSVASSFGVDAQQMGDVLNMAKEDLSGGGLADALAELKT